MQSASECNAVARCYIECLKYIVMLHLSESDFCQALVKNHVCMKYACLHAHMFICFTGATKVELILLV